MAKEHDLEDHIDFEKTLPKSVVIKVLERDGYMCRNCNSDYGLHPHHIVFRAITRDHSLDNLVTLCFKCHRDIHDNRLMVVFTNGSWFFGKIKYD